LSAYKKDAFHFILFVKGLSSGEGIIIFLVLDLADYAYYFLVLPTKGKDIVFRFIIEL
jgi:hypothetical protein